MKRISGSWLFRESLDAVAVMSSVVIGIYLYARVDQGQCASSTNIWLSQQCNPVADSGSIPEDTVIGCYLVPIVAQLLFKGARFRTIVFCWVLETAFVTGAIIRVQGWVQIYTILYSFFFLYISYEVERFMRVAYVQTLQVLAQTERERDFEKLRRDREFAAERSRLELHIVTIQEKQQAEQDKHSMELECDHLRTLIGNVAHDLKTPIQAINMGVEVLRTECLAAFNSAATTNCPSSASSSCPSPNSSSSSCTDDLLKRRDEVSLAVPLEELFSSMFATCRFMTMAINRSIDFTKASSNIQLVPSLETVDFFETLFVPVDCIRNLQSAVAVMVAPLPLDMCPFVITDKHWLGENLLCVLSNAVKYSTGGTVHVNTILKKITSIEDNSDDLHGAVQHPPEGLFFIRVAIIDSGIGITEEKRRNLFQPFQQAQRMAGESQASSFIR
jgi:signal transduction histidine kinase